jgi:hypothetical protein
MKPTTVLTQDPAVYLGSPTKRARALFRSKVEVVVPTQHVNSRIVGRPSEAELQFPSARSNSLDLPRSGWWTIFWSACWVCGTNSSTLERKRPGVTRLVRPNSQIDRDSQKDREIARIPTSPDPKDVCLGRDTLHLATCTLTSSPRTQQTLDPKPRDPRP